MFNTKIYFKSLALLLGQTSYAQFSTLPPHYCSVHNKVLCPHYLCTRAQVGLLEAGFYTFVTFLMV